MPIYSMPIKTLKNGSRILVRTTKFDRVAISAGAYPSLVHQGSARVEVQAEDAAKQQPGRLVGPYFAR